MVADALLRIHAATIEFVDFHQLAEDQSSLIEIKAYRTAITGLILQDVPFEDTTLLCDLSLGKPQPVIPQKWIRKVFATVHSLSHSGPRPTQRAILLIDLFGMASKKMSRNSEKNATATELQRSNDTPKYLFSRDCHRQAVF